MFNIIDQIKQLKMETINKVKWNSLGCWWKRTRCSSVPCGPEFTSLLFSPKGSEFPGGTLPLGLLWLLHCWEPQKIKPRLHHQTGILWGFRKVKEKKGANPDFSVSSRPRIFDWMLPPRGHCEAFLRWAYWGAGWGTRAYVPWHPDQWVHWGKTLWTYKEWRSY